MSRPIFLFVALVACSLAHQTVADADIILDYNAASSTTNPTLTATNVNSNVTADAMAGGAGITATSGSGSWNWRSWDTANSSYAAAVADSDIWTWGFDVTQNVQLDLTTMDIRLDRSSQGPSSFEIRASVNGGSATSLLIVPSLAVGGQDFAAIDLSSLGPLSQGDSVVFTLGAFNSSHINGTFELETFTSQTYGLRINGTITAAVPEPAAIGALTGIAGFYFFRRRKKLQKTNY